MSAEGAALQSKRFTECRTFGAQLCATLIPALRPGLLNAGPSGLMRVPSARERRRQWHSVKEMGQFIGDFAFFNEFAQIRINGQLGAVAVFCCFERVFWNLDTLIQFTFARMRQNVKRKAEKLRIIKLINALRCPDTGNIFAQIKANAIDGGGPGPGISS
jgi:hypothetical protein